MTNDDRWHSSETLAWTDHDGPGRPPAVRAGVLWALGAALCISLVGVLIGDPLCPDHRLVVSILGSVCVLGSIVTVVGLVRQRPTAPLWALVPTAAGIALGLIEVTHDQTRGTMIAVSFGAVFVAAMGIAWSIESRNARWDRDARRSMTADSTGLVDDAVSPPVIAPSPAAAPPVDTTSDEAPIDERAEELEES